MGYNFRNAFCEGSILQGQSNLDIPMEHFDMIFKNGSNISTINLSIQIEALSIA